jgi:dissimilatory sulfite reductase (desulfoviridin) alpha/beta subunit
MQLVGPVPFICECANTDCMEIVRLDLDEYEAARQNPRRFFVAPGHAGSAVAAGAAVTVAETAAYTLVDTIGLAGEIAEARYDDR